ncbi:SDR family NAD(P)-dependent oxidoreductase [Thalassotalea maritima]|uniref:SDR family NAD(P)-dependent oxidoreductase n=1 Tax=Thalassotalea maritima TaxID=3242416 RepID=UPI003526F15F
MKVLITGATSGIGKALAERYQQGSHHVIACGRNQQALDEAQQKGMQPLRFDITDKQGTAQALAKIDNVDVVVINAGDCEYIDDAMQFDAELFKRIIDINIGAVGLLLEQLLPKIKAGGQLVFVSSSVTKLPLPRAEAYGASKAAMDYLANSLRIDLVKHNIDVTLVHPGFIKTPLTDKNTFSMPFLLSAEDAAERMYQGIAKRKNYLQFPKRLTYLLSLLALLPTRLWTKIACRS